MIMINIDKNIYITNQINISTDYNSNLEIQTKIQNGANTQGIIKSSNFDYLTYCKMNFRNSKIG